MFRRIFALLAAMLLLLPVLPVRAEGSFASVFLVVDPLAEDPIGLAALCEGQVYTVSAVAQSRAASPMLLGSRAGMQAVEDYALAPCGLARISAGLEKSAGFAMGELAPGYAQALIRSYWNMATVTVTVTSTVPWQGNSCYLVQSTQALPYGTPVLNADGNLGGLVAAQWSEGAGRYVVVPIQTVRDAAWSPVAPQAEESPADDGSGTVIDGAVPLEGVTLSAQNGLLTISWEGCADLPESGYVTVLLYDTLNPYYTADILTVTPASVPALAVPGRTYEVLVVYTPELPTDTDFLFPDQTQTFTMPYTHPFNRFGYRDTACYLGRLEAGLSEDEAALRRAEAITPSREAFTDPDFEIYWQMASRYRVKKSSSSMITVTLETPEGYLYSLAGTFLFMEELDSEGDVWNVPVQSLLDAYSPEEDGFAAGTYHLSYYFDGSLVNTLTFELD